MKAVQFFPLAFIANIDGFAIFLPYLALFLAVALFLHGRRMALPIPVRVTSALASLA